MEITPHLSINKPLGLSLPAAVSLSRKVQIAGMSPDRGTQAVSAIFRNKRIFHLQVVMAQEVKLMGVGWIKSKM